MSGGKKRLKNKRFLNGGAWAEKVRKIARKHRVFLHAVLPKHCKYQCFWLVCFETWKQKDEENRGICGTFKAHC